MPSRQCTLKALLSLAAVIAASQALAQRSITSNETFKTMIGKWELSNADRDRACQLTFKADPSGTLFKLDLDKACATQMPELKDVTGWTIGGLDLVKLMDSKGKSVFEFSEVESGIFEAQRPGEGIFFMQNAAAAAAVNISLEQMAGDWGVVRGSGKTVCTITLTNAAAGDDAFALKLKPGCEAFVTSFGPAAWYLDRGELVFKSKAGRFWRFEANDPTNWQRVPEGREPINLVRQ
ncbi:MAG TPA: AprI/Inh family metalloprotease inhibitor [Xanthobacteraceae bacterium]|nr:AprI/Inh family metalloprotease inhibitor [Xanthobacteraceae bacterium]